MDRKRVNGPELSVAPIEEHIEKKEILDSKEKRLDGRGIDDIRPICECLPDWLRLDLLDLANNAMNHSHEVWPDKPS